MSWSRHARRGHVTARTSAFAFASASALACQPHSSAPAVSLALSLALSPSLSLLRALLLSPPRLLSPTLPLHQYRTSAAAAAAAWQWGGGGEGGETEREGPGSEVQWSTLFFLSLLSLSSLSHTHLSRVTRSHRSPSVRRLADVCTSPHIATSRFPAVITLHHTLACVFGLALTLHSAYLSVRFGRSGLGGGCRGGAGPLQQHVEGGREERTNETW